MNDLKNEFSWSPSRYRKFDICKRKYYYHYYGSWGGWEDDANESTKEIYSLKNMTNIPRFVGEVVHNAINDILDQLRQGNLIEQNTAEKMVVQSFKKGWRESKKGEWKKSPKWNINLYEHYYNEIPSQDELKEVGDKLVKSIKGFYKSESFVFIKTLPLIDWICKEELASFDFEGTKVYVKLDFAARHGDKVYVYDWKTGKKVFEDEIQLAVYSIYALDNWGINLDNLRLFDVYLIKRMPIKVKVNQPSIDETKVIMRESIAEMKSLLDDVDENVVSFDNFPMIDDTTICKVCQFKGVCYQENWRDLE